MRLWVNPSVSDGDSMLAVIKTFKPTVLLGLTTQGGLFTKELIQTMDANCTDCNPIIMPMSNPTSKAECTAENAYKWTNGRAIVATGSPFGRVTMSDGTIKIPSQCNNM